jgi:cell division protein FtsB
MLTAPDIWSTDQGARVRDALTELHAYTLVLDGELQRTDQRVAELDRADDHSHEYQQLSRRRAEIAAQLELLSSTIRALRAQADPAGRYL